MLSKRQKGIVARVMFAVVEMTDWKVFYLDEQDLHAAASRGCYKGLFTVRWRRDQAYERERAASLCMLHTRCSALVGATQE